MGGDATFSDDEGRVLARIEVEHVGSRPIEGGMALHITGRVVPPRVIDGDVIDYEPEVTVEGQFEPDLAERGEQQLAAAGGIERVLKAYEGIAVNGMTAEETMRALREKCGLGEVLEGQIVDAPGYGTSYHYPHCNIGACTGCIPQEVVDDYADFAPKFQSLLNDMYTGLLRDFEENAPHAATYMTVDEAKAWAGYKPVEDEDGAPSAYDLGRLAWMYRYRLTADTLRWSDIRITGLGSGT